MKISALLIGLVISGAIGFTVANRSSQRSIDNLSARLKTSEENSANLQSQVDSLNQKITALSDQSNQSHSELAAKISAKKAEISDIQSQLAVLQNGGTRNYSGQDDESLIRNRKNEIASAQAQLRDLQNQRKALLQGAKLNTIEQKKATQAYYRTQLQSAGNAIQEQKNQIKQTQQSISITQRTRSIEQPEQLAKLNSELATQRAALDQMVLQQNDLKATLAQLNASNASEPVSTDEIDMRIEKKQAELNRLEASLGALNVDYKRSSTEQKSLNQQIESLKAQLSTKQAELNELKQVPER